MMLPRKAVRNFVLPLRKERSGRVVALEGLHPETWGRKGDSCGSVLCLARVTSGYPSVCLFCAGNLVRHIQPHT
jgi:hypothetical protein